MDRSNHYESAFEAYLRNLRVTLVAVDESRRSALDDGTIKSLDFIVHGGVRSKLLIDVKGRKFPGGPADRRTFTWQNWSSRDDIHGLLNWEERFGPGYRGLLVFVYQLLPTIVLPLGTRDLWNWRDRRYLIRAVTARDYQQKMRVRSPRWGTVHLPTGAFREMVRPFSDFLG